MLTRRQPLISAAVAPLAKFCGVSGGPAFWIDESYRQPELLGYAIENSVAQADGTHIVRVRLTSGQPLRTGRMVWTTLLPGTL